MNIRKIVNRSKQSKGITLIALIITILVMIILAGVAIMTAVGDNGIMNNAKKAGEEQNYQTAKERVLTQIEYEITGKINLGITEKNINNRLKDDIVDSVQNDGSKLIVKLKVGGDPIIISDGDLVDPTEEYEQIKLIVNTALEGVNEGQFDEDYAMSYVVDEVNKINCEIIPVNTILAIKSNNSHCVYMFDSDNSEVRNLGRSKFIEKVGEEVEVINSEDGTIKIKISDNVILTVKDLSNDRIYL